MDRWWRTCLFALVLVASSEALRTLSTANKAPTEPNVFVHDDSQQQPSEGVHRVRRDTRSVDNTKIEVNIYSEGEVLKGFIGIYGGFKLILLQEKVFRARHKFNYVA
jgi:hypothetical protein